jgi:hypothetical protein
MFGASMRYRSSREYMELLNFISKFRRYAPFNGLLLHLQNTGLYDRRNDQVLLDEVERILI